MLSTPMDRRRLRSPKGTRQFERAPQERLAAVGQLAPRFFQNVVGWDYAEVLVTDESDLSDFADVMGDRKAQVSDMLDRMAAHYGVDSRVVGSARIVDLLEFLAARGRPD